VAVTPSGGTEFVGTGSGGLMKSTNGGSSWVASNGGITGGNTSSVGAVAIQTSSPSTMYMSVDGALYKSTTGASSWTSSSSGISAAVNGIAIDPTNSNILYVATDIGGIFKSTTGGSSWVAITNGLPRNSEYNVVRVDPTTHTTVYAAGVNGIYKSTTSGSSWTHSFSGIPFGTSVNDLAIDPANDTILLAATDNGVYRSSNSGLTWAAASGGSGGNSFVVFGLGSSSATDYSGGFGGVLKSTNSGASWSAANTGLPTTTSSPAALAIDPANQADLFVGLSYPSAVSKSTTAAGSWATASIGINQIGTGPLAVLSSTTFLVGTSGTANSVYTTTNDGASFTASGSGIPSFDGVTEFQVISATKVYALTFDGVYVTTNGGTSWTLVPNSNSFSGGISFAVQTNNNSHIDVFTFGGFFETTTGGSSSWTHKNPACFPLFADAFDPKALAMEPASSSDSALATTAGVFWTTNDWSSCTKASGTVPAVVNGLSFDPSHPTTLWAWGAGASKATFGGSFSAVSALGSAFVDDLWFNPASSGNILAAEEGLGIAQSTSDGSSFSPITSSGLVSTTGFSAVAKAGSTVAAALPSNSVAVITP
jgi:photosystem II stability/assembly factor-like uncharacterized protein